MFDRMPPEKLAAAKKSAATAAEVKKLVDLALGDDATDAVWLPADTVAELESAARAYGGLYGAHRPMLADLLA